MRIISSFYSIIVLTGLLPAHTLHAQQSGEMLMIEIDGNRYKKCNYNNKGELESYEKFIIGSIEQQSDLYRLPVDLYSYNAEGELQDSTRTLYTCRPDSAARDRLDGPIHYLSGVDIARQTVENVEAGGWKVEQVNDLTMGGIFKRIEASNSA